ncbi:substrate-binding domain-containing protein [Mycolicibacterium gilvum]|uniref:von Willebrand factor, type A n=1 Tax=Mycolicibacterium gilvum TaxID=1804 RepID=A0A378SN12_9MYCO|nr:substrate-binding domain-containing protein [Mycolicibacterium gilvum]MCV7054643.1 substrate-binding domain-containing protein [Mycolicibacterium gilvum]STZ43765.1 von Willebrand factor, type A [Mycolicibacterium gilvum]
MGRHSLPDPDEAGGRRSEPPVPRDGSESDSPTDVFGDDEQTSRLATGGGQRSGGWENGEWTGSHRAVTPGPRKVSVGVIVALVSVVVVVAAVILWRFVGDTLSDRSDIAAARCVEGEVAVAVIADPAIADPVAALAQRYNETADPVGDRCVKVGVTPADSGRVVNGFGEQWPGDLGERPALWIPASSVSEARLEASTGPESISDSRSLVTSPVLLAVAAELKDALGGRDWGSLPDLQSNPNSLDGLGLRGWGSLRLAMPLGDDSDASFLAAEAVAAAAAPAGEPATAGLGAVSTLLWRAPELSDADAGTALDALADASDNAAAPVHAVVTTEQRVFQRASTAPDADSKPAAWLPSGPAVLADFPTVLLSGDWLSQEQVTGASEFARFLRKPEQLGELAKAGFRVEGVEPPASDVVDFAPLSAPLAVEDNQVRTTIADTLTMPVETSTVTVMLDQSMPVDEGGATRLANVVDALKARIPVLPPDSGVGLWTFDGVAGRSEVAVGPLADPVDGTPRSEALTAALDRQTASGGGAVSFTTLRLVYGDATARFREGQKNSVLVITTGPHTDRSLGAQGLQDYIRGAFTPDRPVAVNVIDFGDDADRPTWESVAEITGGSYRNMADSTSPDLSSAISEMLG